ncbi:unnamed protein product, partial [marine sediment metagenome]
TISTKNKLGTLESDMTCLYGKFVTEPMRGYKILNKFLEEKFTTVLDIYWSR